MNVSKPMRQKRKRRRVRSNMRKPDTGHVFVHCTTYNVPERIIPPVMIRNRPSLRWNQLSLPNTILHPMSLMRHK